MNSIVLTAEQVDNLTAAVRFASQSGPVESLTVYQAADNPAVLIETVDADGEPTVQVMEADGSFSLVLPGHSVSARPRSSTGSDARKLLGL